MSYIHALTNIRGPQIPNGNVRFQKDDATFCTAKETIQILKTNFLKGLISRFGGISWAPRFCNLTPLHFFSWGTLSKK